MKIGKPIKYIAVPPEEVLERVKNKITQDAQDQAKNLDTLKESDILSELSVLHNNGVELVEPTDLTASFRGRNRVYDQILLMLKDAQEEFILVSTEAGLVRKMDFLSRAFKKAAQRGVDIKIAAPITCKETQEAIKELEGIAQVRHIEHIKARFAIADGQELTFLLFDDEEIHHSYDVGVWVNTPFFAGAVQQLFELAWNSLEIKIKK